MQPTLPTPPTYRGALWVNSSTWVLLVLGGLGVLLLWCKPAVIAPLLLMPLVTGLGLVANLLLGLRSFVKGKQKWTGLYLLGFLLLVVCLRGQFWWVKTYVE
ncbi:MAG: hypothetical protein EOO60_02860 [Hymenobacter sp.]|nr:MAG: hypothetical protein EOO60_02860 [Hymenobacter sp.]